MRVVVTGMIASFGVGGVFWDYAQYALGFERLGCEVWYLEDAGIEVFDPEVGSYGPYWQDAGKRLQANLEAVSPTLGERWHLRAYDGRTFGVSDEDMAEVLATADLFINVSGGAFLRDHYRDDTTTVLIDTDPGWNHYDRWPRQLDDPDKPGGTFLDHDVFFTYATRIGQDDCPLPDFGLTWHPTRPPVVLDQWPPNGDTREAWTTVFTWSNYDEPVLTDGSELHARETEFPKIEQLPRDVEPQLEVAVGGSQPPVDRWRAAGWSVVAAPEISRTPDAYRDYITDSRGELAVAKNVYTATNSGWFSCRSTCYLAAGRPVVIQDTGWSRHLPSGAGLHAFTDRSGATRAIEHVENDWEKESEAARSVATTEFDAAVVLTDLLEKAVA